MDPYSTVTLTLMTQNIGLTAIAVILMVACCVFSYYSWQIGRANRATTRAQLEVITRRLDTLQSELRQALDDAQSEL